VELLLVALLLEELPEELLLEELLPPSCSAAWLAGYGDYDRLQ